MFMEIQEIKKSDEKKWDEYVLNHPNSTFYHQLKWEKVVNRCYGHKSYYLLATEDEYIRGLLPLFFMKSMFFGNKMVSLPFAPYGGVIADSSEVEKLLIQSAIKITQDVGGDYLEIRDNLERDSELVMNTRYKTMILKLNKDPELVWRSFSNKVRNAIKKSLNFKLHIGKGNVEEFYNLYSKNMRDLGTPTHSKKFFHAIISEFNDQVDILVVKKDNKPVSSAIIMNFKETSISGWAASDRSYNSLNSNNLLYWSAIKSACENGYEFFDFGRSIEGSGTFRFKKPWGAEPHQLFYSYYLNSSIKILPNTSTLNTKRILFSKIYKIAPLQIANIIGPGLRRHFA